MIVYPKKMTTNLNITKGIIFSQELMLELTKTNLSREKSYRLVQTHAKKCITHNLWDELETHINNFFEKNTLRDVLFRDYKAQQKKAN